MIAGRRSGGLDGDGAGVENRAGDGVSGRPRWQVGGRPSWHPGASTAGGRQSSGEPAVFGW